MKPDPIDLERTRHRLIEAAGEVFAAKGFKDATIRDICQQARANVAAVNYHFGDKAALYTAALRYAHDCARRFDVEMPQPARASAEVRLKAFLRAMMMGFFEEGKPAWHAKLVAREMAEPSGVLAEIIAQTVRPRFELLGSIVRAVLGGRASDELVRDCARSVVGQALFYHFARPMLTRMFPTERIDTCRIDALVDHIAEFSLHGLRGLAKRSKKSNPRKRARRKGRTA